jgi:hypothetical protein
MQQIYCQRDSLVPCTTHPTKYYYPLMNYLVHNEQIIILIAVFFFKLQALEKLLHDPKFAEAAKEIGSTLNDQITRPLDRAIWWVEHVMRHPTMYAGKSPFNKLYWYQYFLLDVLAVYTVILYITYQILKFFFFLCFCNDSSRVITLDSSKAKRD